VGGFVAKRNIYQRGIWDTFLDWRSLSLGLVAKAYISDMAEEELVDEVSQEL
jgi:hypothetical protein